MFTAKVIHIRKIGGDKAIIRLRPDPAMGFAHQTGQYVKLAFEGFEQKSYSIANAPNGDFLEIHIRDNGQGSAGCFACNELAENDDVGLEGPFGDVVWSPSANRPLILIAGGMGIVPMKALAEEYLSRKHHKRVTLYWGVKNADDLYLDDVLTSYADDHDDFVYRPVVGGAIGEQLSGDDSIDLSDADIYVSGPEAMIMHTVPLLIDKGARKDGIHGDHRELLQELILKADARAGG